MFDLFIVKVGGVPTAVVIEDHDSYRFRITGRAFVVCKSNVLRVRF